VLNYKVDIYSILGYALGKLLNSINFIEMSDLDFNSKGLARSKHFHSLHKDKNKWKKKGKHVATAKQQKEQEGKTNEKSSTEEKKDNEDQEGN
jgi:hypothetical protein